jgi:transposase
MIVIGVDVHKHSLTAAAVDELGRTLAEHAGLVDAQVIGWARSLGEERLWAVEDCRHVTRGPEQRLVRVPPRLTAPQRRRGRSRGKSDACIGRADQLLSGRRATWHLRDFAR